MALRPVTVAQYREDGVVVRGLANGEWVVAAGVHKLQPGQTVRPYEGGGAAVPATVPTTPAGAVARGARSARSADTRRAGPEVLTPPGLPR